MKTEKVVITSIVAPTVWYASKKGQKFDVVSGERVHQGGRDHYRVFRDGRETHYLIDVADASPMFSIQSIIDNGSLIRNPQIGGISNGKFIGYAFEFPLDSENRRSLTFVIDESGTPIKSVSEDCFVYPKTERFAFVVQPLTKRWKWAYAVMTGWAITDTYFTEREFAAFADANQIMKFERIEKSEIEV